MRIIDRLFASAVLLTPLEAFAVANEAIPYAIQSVAASSSGFIELIGPGKLVVKSKVAHYRKGKYIRAANIHSLSDVEGNSERCVLHYASYDFSENISVKQSCKQVLKVISAVESQQRAGALAAPKSAVPKFRIK